MKRSFFPSLPTSHAYTHREEVHRESESPSRVFSLCSQALSTCCVASNADVSSNLFKRWSSMCAPKCICHCCKRQGIAGLPAAHPSCVHDEGQLLRVTCPSYPAVQLGKSLQYSCHSSRRYSSCVGAPKIAASAHVMCCKR